MRVSAVLLLAGLAGSASAGAQPGPGAPAGQASASTAPATALALSASFGTKGPAIRSGLRWRVYAAPAARAAPGKLVARSTQAAPILPLPPGAYVVHAAYGLAGAAETVAVPARGAQAAHIALDAGALRVRGVLGSQAIPASRLAVDVYVPEPGNSEAKIIVKGAPPDQAIGLPEGLYHVVSTYLDTVGEGALVDSSRGLRTNSVISADLRVQTGKLTDVTLRHRAAVLTLKLVKSAGGEALANTNFTVLTPGGDVIRELIGAFPSLVLAEGDYVVIARHEGQSYQANFSVKSGGDRDIDVIAKPDPGRR